MRRVVVVVVEEEQSYRSPTKSGTAAGFMMVRRWRMKSRPKLEQGRLCTREELFRILR